MVVLDTRRTEDDDCNSGDKGCAKAPVRREGTMGKSNRRRGDGGRQLESVAHNGLLDRRALLGRGAVLAGAMTTGVGVAFTGAAAEPLTDQPLTDQPWSLETGAVTPPLQTPSRF